MRSCIICNSESKHWGTVDGLDFYRCLACGLICLNEDFIQKIDAGFSIRKYNEDYWLDELKSAAERSWGSSVARVAESILYAKRPIEKYIDIGCGSGALLDSLSFYLPTSKNKFYGVELFPPSAHTDHKNYIVGGLADITLKFDAGCCIEVIEHLTPQQLNMLFGDLSKCSMDGSLYIFNTGLADWVDSSNRDYIDPYKRGHIASYSLKSLEIVANKHGFMIHEIKGKDWAFIAEYNAKADKNEDITDRIWSPLLENKNILVDAKTGSVAYILGLESARAYS